MVVFYCVSFTFLTLALKTMDLSIAYAIWAGLGTALIAGIGIWWFKEPVSALKVVSLMLVIAGIVSIVRGGVLAGIVLESREDALVAAVPALLGLVPPFAAMCGSLGGLLSSRLSSKLHLGLLEPRLLPGKLAALDVSLTFLLAFLAFTGTGAIGWVGAAIVGTTPPSVFMLLAVAHVGGIMATVALSAVAYAAAVASVRFGFDPDNHGIPIVTAAMDFLGILCLVSAVAIIGVG